MVLVPGALLTLLTLAFNFVGDGMRDAFDPSSHGR
jgi:ABC-type dipeptide/oligopeptide/nickel transport system permease subunit